jgi:hypothetical protein
LLRFDQGHRNLLLQSDTAIAAAGAVDLDQPFVFGIGDFCASNTNGAAADPENVACYCSHESQIRRRDAHNCMTYIFDARFGYAQS